jgi:glycolate oxidase FAD binding subunit
MRFDESKVESRKSSVTTVDIDGVAATETIQPADALEVAEALAESHTRAEAVAPVGGGTALYLGNPPERVDRVLSTTRLAGIIDYEPTDLVLSVGAGAKFGDVQAVLAEHGQRLPLDPPGGSEATIGGLIATGRAGPLRTSAGTLRDLLIGIAVAHPSGSVSRAGGMVVKNVSGYDMPRLYHGSLGTLGVIVSANFKVLPRPRAEASLISAYPGVDEAFAAASRVRASYEPVAALEVQLSSGEWRLAVRVEGRAPTVEAIVERVAALAGGDQRRLNGAESATWWPTYVKEQTPSGTANEVLVRCGARPKETATLALGLVGSMATIGVDVSSLAASPGLGLVSAALDLGASGSAERLAEVQAILNALAGNTTIVAAPPAWKRGLDVWGPLPEGFETMRALREQFDPGRVVNPGRFAGFL